MLSPLQAKIKGLLKDLNQNFLFQELSISGFNETIRSEELKNMKITSNGTLKKLLKKLEV